MIRLSIHKYYTKGVTEDIINHCKLIKETFDFIITEGTLQARVKPKITRSNEYKIKRLILRHYDKTTRPVRNDSTPIAVHIAISLYHILDTVSTPRNYYNPKYLCIPYFDYHYLVQVATKVSPPRIHPIHILKSSPHNQKKIFPLSILNKKVSKIFDRLRSVLI